MRRMLLLAAVQTGTLAVVHKEPDEEPLTEAEVIFYTSISVALVLVAGIMSGLTLGLMSLDVVDLQVLIRSGTDKEKRYAAAIEPLVKHQHYLLVTLLLCNAAAMEALPLFIDRLADPVTAIVISVTAVLLFGEIIPQAVCSRYGLAIGYYMSWMVYGLMFLTAPISWPISKLLDLVLGHEQQALFRRTQLKALVDIHGADEGLGGNLSMDEVKVIRGALDLTAKTARVGMTPIDKVFMLPSDGRLDADTMTRVLQSGHSRIPVYAGGDRNNIIGLIMVKELVQYRTKDEVTIADIRMRSLPRLPADTPMYDMLKLFQTGRSHMVMLTDRLSHLGGVVAELEAETNGNDRPPRLHMSESGPLPFPEYAHNEHDALVCVGIVTIEDVIEELMQAEIVDETDAWVDNERSIRVNAVNLAQALPARLRAALAAQQAQLSPGTRPHSGPGGLTIRKAQLKSTGAAEQPAAASAPAAAAIRQGAIAQRERVRRQASDLKQPLLRPE